MSGLKELKVCNYIIHIYRNSIVKFLPQKTYHSLLVSVVCFAENKSVLHFENLDWCLRNNSLEDTGGTWAMVGAILAGSSSDIEMWRAIGFVS